MTVVARHSSYNRGHPPAGLVRRVEAEQSLGIVQATRIQAGAHVTQAALSASALLSSAEENCVRMAPLGEARYKLIVDAFTMFAAGEVANMGRPW